jgi:hypothetical protein
MKRNYLQMGHDEEELFTDGISIDYMGEIYRWLEST